MNKVDIVLATYNGEKYLAEQLDSIIAQTHKNWTLLISDDGSSDRTLSIIERYTANDNRILLINSDRQGGVIKNFAKGLEFVSSDYIMFSDQDDIWFCDKISSMLAALKALEFPKDKGIPIFGFSDLCLVEEAGNIIHKSFYKFNNLNPRYNFDFRYLSWRSTVFGCTVIFNRILLNQALPLPLDIPMHDQWFALIAARVGVVFYLPKSTIYYRQHNNNVIGGIGKGWAEKFISIRILYGNIKSAALKCTNQANYVASGRWGKVKFEDVREEIPLNSVGEKIKFIKSCVLPYWHERKIYSVLFAIILFFK